MTIVADKALLRARFLSEFDTDSIQTLFNNAPQTSIDLTRPFVRFGINSNDTTRETFGVSGIHETHGLVWLQVLAPKGEGTKVADEIVDAFIAVFRNWRSDSSDLFCTTETVREVNNDEHYQVNVFVPYTSCR